MNSIIMSFGDGAEMNEAYARLKKQYPKSRMAKADIDIEDIEDIALYDEAKSGDDGYRVGSKDLRAKYGI
ncbi:MAG: hypothetical protein FWH48_01595 [Oscillospiraceae bacterium]|nr:hypothetical protein [Oscillospiraceae bacterium]